MKYRADIDGLRALAVLSVIFYHLGFTTFFASGFIGVDIFFVISGYLITSIIYKEMNNSAFSYLDFYERRVRRIFPIFLFVLFVSLIFAHYIAFYDLRGFTNSLFSALIMGGNFHFWKDADYFSLPAHMKPLLHTWSLGVEEQFYLIFPPLLLFFSKRKYPIIPILFFISIISLSICILQSKSTAETAFYLLPYRLWELLAGSILAILAFQNVHIAKSPLQAQILNISALILIFFSIIFLNYFSFSFPSFLPIFPCLGAILFIDAGRYQNFVTRIFSSKALVFIGKISFSLYLWHWVVIVFAKDSIIINNENSDLYIAISCLSLSFILSICSYFLIEQPIRKKKILKDRKKLFLTMFMATAILAALAFLVKKEILPQLQNMNEIKYYQDINGMTHSPQYADYKNLGENLQINDAQLIFWGAPNIEPTLFVYGDSHTRTLIAILDKLGKEYHVSGICYGTNRFLFNTASGTSIDKAINDTQIIKNYLKDLNIISILLSSRWGYRFFGYDFNKKESIRPTAKYFDANTNTEHINPEEAGMLGLLDTIDFFPANTKIFIKTAIPEFEYFIPQRASKLIRFYDKNSEEFRKNLSITRESFEDFNKETNEIFKKLSTIRDINFIDVTNKLCDKNRCYGVDEFGVPYYYDDDHLTIDATMLMKEELLPFILSGKKD